MILRSHLARRAISFLALSALLCGCERSGSTPSPKTVETIYGNKFDFLSEGQTTWVTTRSGRFHAYDLSIAVPHDIDADGLEKLETTVFKEFAGPRAVALGFRRVVITPVDLSQSSGLNLFGIKLSVDVSAGPGPLPAATGAYEESADGTWSRNGEGGPPMEYIATSSLKSGERFGLEYSVEDFPRATYIYDCLSCVGDTAPEQLFKHVYEMFTEVVLPDANREGLTSLHVVIFLGPRKTTWQFPLSIDLNLEKHRDGRWWGPIASPEQFAQVFNRQIAEYREMGRRMRGETAK